MTITVGTFQANPLAKTLVNEVLDSGIISYGPKTRAFEQQFAARHGCQYGLFANSGTSALQVALQAMKEVEGWADGDQVIVPATTFVATANIVGYAGLEPIFADVSWHTWNLDRNVIGEVTSHTRAIIPVHLLGLPSDVRGLKSYLKHLGRDDLKILEDSCETMFATAYDESVGALGDVAAFSTYVAHLLVTGVGGLSTTNNPAYAGKMRSLLNHGLELDQLNPDENFAPQPMRGRRFLFDTHGHSYRLTEMEAALGLAQLTEADAALAQRQTLAAHYKTRLDDLNLRYDHLFAYQETPPWATHAYMIFGIALEPPKFFARSRYTPSGGKKESLTTHLHAHGIETRDIPTLLGQKVYANLAPTDYPVSHWLWKTGFYVGCHAALTLDDVDYVMDKIELWITH